MKNKLPEEVEQVLLGSMFGDGGIYKRYKGIHFQEAHSLKQKDYLLWKKQVLSKEFIIKEVICQNNSQLLIRSLISPLFNRCYKYFYPTGKYAHSTDDVGMVVLDWNKSNELIRIEFVDGIPFKPKKKEREKNG